MNQGFDWSAAIEQLQRDVENDVKKEREYGEAVKVKREALLKLQAVYKGQNKRVCPNPFTSESSFTTFCLPSTSSSLMLERLLT